MRQFDVKKTKGYTVMPNYHLRDKSLTLKAKGLLSLMLSLPESWDYSKAGLEAIIKEGKAALNGALTELQQAGYLTITEDRTDGGRFGYLYTVYEVPPHTDLPHTDLPHTDYPHTVNQQQINNKQLNTNISTKDKTSGAGKTRIVDIINDYTDDERTRELLQEWLRNRKSKRAACTEKAIELNLRKLDKLASDSGYTVNGYLEEVIARGWAAFFEVKNYNKNKDAFQAIKEWGEEK